MSEIPSVIAGVIKTAPTADMMPNAIEYTADINIGGTLYRNQPVPRPVMQQWNTLVRPFPRGTGILGVLVNGVAQWNFREVGALGPCNGDGGGGGPIDLPPGQSDPRPGGPIRPVFPVPTPGIPGAPSPLMQFLLMASRTELLALKRALEAV